MILIRIQFVQVIFMRLKLRISRNLNTIFTKVTFHSKLNINNNAISKLLIHFQAFEVTFLNCFQSHSYAEKNVYPLTINIIRKKKFKCLMSINNMKKVVTV